MKRLLAAVIVAGVFAACGGKIEGAVDGGSGWCCNPSAVPSCCMSIGGYTEVRNCVPVCDGIPTPDTPGWTLGTDAHGCKTWQQPANATNYCGGVVVDASPPPPPAPTCPTPADVSQWTAPPFIPPVVQKGSCTSQQIQDLFNACFSPTNNQTQCNSFQQANAACVSCALTKPQAPGPLVEGTALVTLNIPGCIAIVTGDASPSSCAARLQTVDACEEAACAAQCPVTDAQSFQQYVQCTQTAASGGCKTYVGAECAIDGGAAGQCLVSDFQTGFMTLVPLFCGP